MKKILYCALFLATLSLDLRCMQDVNIEKGEVKKRKYKRKKRNILSAPRKRTKAQQEVVKQEPNVLEARSPFSPSHINEAYARLVSLCTTEAFNEFYKTADAASKRNVIHIPRFEEPIPDLVSLNIEEELSDFRMGIHDEKF